MGGIGGWNRRVEAGKGGVGFRKGRESTKEKAKVSQSSSPQAGEGN